MRFKASKESIGDLKEWERKSKNGAEASIWTVDITAERGAEAKRDLPKKISYIINGDGAGHLQFADKPEKAPIIHLNGPFTLALQDWRQKLLVGTNSILQIGVGPQGLGAGTFAFVRYANTIPSDVYPEADISFPVKGGEESIMRKYTLKERC